MGYSTLNIDDGTKLEVDRFKLDLKEQGHIKGRVTDDKMVRLLIKHFKKNPPPHPKT